MKARRVKKTNCTQRNSRSAAFLSLFALHRGSSWQFEALWDGCCLSPVKGKCKRGFQSHWTPVKTSCSPTEQGPLQQEGLGAFLAACPPSSSALFSAGCRCASGMQGGKGKCGIHKDLFSPLTPHLLSCFQCKTLFCTTQLPHPRCAPWGIQFSNKIRCQHTLRAPQDPRGHGWAVGAMRAAHHLCLVVRYVQV